MTNIQKQILDAIIAERSFQDSKWGIQHHPLKNETAFADREYKSLSKQSKEACDYNISMGIQTWRDIIKEEFDEVFAENEKNKQIEELLQTAAVVVATIEDLLSRE